jgi:hypothetical protein
MSTPENLATLLGRLTDNLNILEAAVKRDDEAIRRLTAEVERLNALAGPGGKSLGELETINDELIAEIERLTAAHHAAVEMSNTMHGRWLAAEAERDALRKGAPAPLTDERIDAAVDAWFASTLLEDGNLRAFRERMRAAMKGDKP